MSAAKVANVAGMIAQQARRAGAVGKTIKVRAIEKGFYGRPLPDLRYPGDEFLFAVKDLEPFAKTKDRTSIEVDGTKYLLPTWVEDASTPARAPVEPDEADDDLASDDVI